MSPLMGLTRLSVISLLATTIPTAQAASIFLRQSATCGGNKDLAQCGNGFPSEFCCPTNSECKSLNTAEGVSAICCPKGQSCSFIRPITCDISQLNATLHPDNQIHLANSSVVELPKCGTQCCPLGYACKDNMCSAVEGNTPSPSSTGSPIVSPTPSVTGAPSESQTTGSVFPPVVQVEQGFNAKSFAAGFFPGIVLGVLLTLGLIWLIKKRREVNEKSRYSGDFGHVSRQISDPIYDPAHAARVDFIRRTPQSAQHSPNSTTGFMQQSKPAAGGLTPKIKSMWERTPKLSTFSFSSGNNAVPYSGLPAHPAPPAPAVRAGDHRDPYRTPRHTPARTVSSRSRSTSIGTASITKHSAHGKKPAMTHHDNRPFIARGASTETIDVLMPAPSESLLRPPSFLQPPKPPGMRDNRLTTDSNQTTFTKLMERAGYEEDDRNGVRNWKGSPGKAR